jgi:5'-3' exonuclease
MQNITSSLKEWAEEYSKKYKIKIIFSPASVPGEGEHKLLQHIRNTNEELKYAVYGLDADLIFLMLATQKNNIYLMREANKMDEKNDGINFISITKMKECIVNSIRDIVLKDETLKELNIIYDTNRIVDDFLFICSLMGNDFLPHMPSLDIYENAIDTLMQTYVDIVIANNTFIVDRNTRHYINNNVFYDFLVRLASSEETTLKLAFGKKKRYHSCQSSDPFDIEMHRIENMMFKVKDPIMIGSDNITDWTSRYYKHYYKVEPAEISGTMTKHYMIGLKWIIMYYLDKCPSWDWYYIYDHAPFLTDMVRDKTIIDEVFTELVFTEGKPLSPFEQLLTILPKQSSYLLPIPLRKIMNNVNGSASHLYPTKFDIDMIGKKKYWMCTPILPKLEISLIKKIFEKYSKLLPSDLRTLNKIETVFEY